MIETMIFSESFGSKSFNINVDDRQDCMNAIFNDTDFDITGVGESVKIYMVVIKIFRMFSRQILQMICCCIFAIGLQKKYSLLRL